MSLKKNLKIAILGTRGIPNYYGGFEQVAESLSLRFAKAGHQVVVYNTDEHPYKKKEWHGVQIKHLFCHESTLRVLGTFIYDALCLQDAIRGSADIILEMGYVPSAFCFRFHQGIRPKIVTNMDGLEWRRTKWGPLLRRFARYCEASAVRFSDALISDNPGIRDYILKKYGKDSFYIGYGATLFEPPSEQALRPYGLKKHRYRLLVARLEPENNIETILNGALLSKDKTPVIVVGNDKTSYGRSISEKYKSNEKIKLLGGIYNNITLNTLRFFCRQYFHGHSVGGTNPSLLEAMASNASIVAHKNPFNRAILGEDALYFSSATDVARIIDTSEDESREACIMRNREKIRQLYHPDLIAEEYLKVFEKILRASR